MRRSMNSAWLGKLMVALARKHKMPLQHVRLQMQLARNRGKALGYPKPYPKTRMQQKREDAKYRRQIAKSSPPF